jgi:hypothetical protein
MANRQMANGKNPVVLPIYHFHPSGRHFSGLPDLKADGMASTPRRALDLP